MRECNFKKVLFKKNSKKEFKPNENGILTLKTDEYYLDDEFNTYFCFAGAGVFEIKKTKNINFDKVLSVKKANDYFAFDALDKEILKHQKAFAFVFDEKEHIDKRYFENIERLLVRKVSNEIKSDIKRCNK